MFGGEGELGSSSGGGSSGGSEVFFIFFIRSVEKVKVVNGFFFNFLLSLVVF